MGKIKIFWPTVLAISVAVTLNSCQNERMKKEYEKKQLPSASNYQFNDVYEPAKIDLDKYKLDTLDDIVLDEELEDEENKEETEEEIDKKGNVLKKERYKKR